MPWAPGLRLLNGRNVGSALSPRAEVASALDDEEGREGKRLLLCMHSTTKRGGRGRGWLGALGGKAGRDGRGQRVAAFEGAWRR